MNAGTDKTSHQERARPARRLTRVRQARLADVEPMVDLLALLFEQEADFAPSPAKQRRALELVLAQPAMGRVFVLTRNRKVLGMVSLLFTISTAEGGQAAWLEDLVVRPEHRGRGLGTRLLQEAVEWARKQGITRISLLTDAHNLGARGLYMRHGFSPSAMQPLRLYLGRKSRRRAPVTTMA